LILDEVSSLSKFNVFAQSTFLYLCLRAFSSCPTSDPLAGPLPIEGHKYCPK
jgi:hypothetical protein